MFMPLVLGSSAHRFWRVRNTQQATAGGSPIQFSANELQMRSVAGDAASDLCSGGTAVASSNAGAAYVASKAFDNSTAADTGWLASSTAVGEWVGYDFGLPVSPVELWFYPFNVFGAPVNSPAIAIEYSDDGTTYSLAKAYTGLTWTLATPKTFTI